MPEAKPHTPSLFNCAIIGIAIFGLMLFMITAMNTGDMLWFWPGFKEIPVNIIVHCYGTNINVKPGQPAFEAVNTEVNRVMTGVKRWDNLSMSDVTYQEYQTSQTMMVMELHYDPPVTVHSQYKYFKGVNWLIIPLDGRHSTTNAVFGRQNGFTGPGSIHSKSTASIATALQEQGICTKP